MTLCSFDVPGTVSLPVLANTAMWPQIVLKAQNCEYDRKEPGLPDKEMRDAVIRLAPRLAISQSVIDCEYQRVNEVLTEIDRVHLAS